MFSEIAGLLGGFQNFILCLVIGLVIVTVITLAGFTLFGFEHPFLGWYALFLNEKRKRTISFAVSLLRMFFVGAMVGMAKNLSLTHCLVYLLFTLLLWVLLLRPVYWGHDLLYSAGLFGITYLLYLMHKELVKVQVQDGMKLLTILFSVLLIIVAIGQFFIAINAMLPKEVNKTERDDRLWKGAFFVLPCMLLVLILPFLILTNTYSITLPDGGIQFTEGEKSFVEPGSKITKADDGCMVSNGDDSYLLSGTPVYDKAEDRVVFTKYCSIVRPKMQLTNRISPMCMLMKDESGFQVKNGDKLSMVENFFLFDGNDTYYFPERTVLTWGEQEIVLSSFSAVKVTYHRQIEIFDYKEESHSVYETTDEFCIATLQGREKVNLSTDILYRENGEEQMLFMQPTLLSDLE